MDYNCVISQSEEYKNFRSHVPLRKIYIDNDSSKVWKMYDAGPREVKNPIVFLPPVSGNADCFFQQLLSLTSRGIRVILIDSPPYFNINSWCSGFRHLLRHLDLDYVHLFGASLGGFLAQKFCEYTHKSPCVASLILCNTYTDSKIFNHINSPVMFKVLPATLLRKYVMQRLPDKFIDARIADSIDFMAERLEDLMQDELASRLTLTCSESYIEPQKVKAKVMIMDVFDESALQQSVKDEMYKCYPEAKLAHLKTGGNYPYLSRPDEVNMYIQIHLRDFLEGKHSPFKNEPNA